MRRAMLILCLALSACTLDVYPTINVKACGDGPCVECNPVLVDAGEDAAPVAEPGCAVIVYGNVPTVIQ